MGMSVNKQKMQAKSANQQTSDSILYEAHNLVRGQRQADYGDKLVNFSQIAQLWNAAFALKLNSPLTAEDVALGMMQVKIARLQKTPSHKDSIVDIAGYAECFDLLRKERVAGTDLPGILEDNGE